jgi:hypothetical protein
MKKVSPGMIKKKNRIEGSTNRERRFESRNAIALSIHVARIGTIAEVIETITPGL